jgi:ribosomal silencing factor RsfS
MQAEARSFYDLERLWSDIPVDSTAPAGADTRG